MFMLQSWWRHVCLLMLVLTLDVSVAGATDRVLTFPSESVGVVGISNMPQEIGPDLIFDADYTEVRQAKGRIAFRKEGLIAFEVASKASADLLFLQDLRTDLLGSLTISGATLGKPQLQQITQLKSLIKLELNDCNFTEQAFDELVSLPELRLLKISHRSEGEEKDGQGQAISRWVANQPKLRIVYAYPSFNLADLRIIADRSKLSFMNVSLGRDAKDVLECLNKMPELKSLSLTIENEVDETALNDIGRLRQIKSLRWFHGRVDGEVLKKIAENDRLEQLVLFSIKPGLDFGAGLEGLTRLTKLELSNIEQSENLKGLTDHLLRMPSLRNWPRLENVDSATLDRITATRHIESLDLNDVAADVTPDNLRRIGEMKSLRHLQLEHVPIKDDWLSSLSGLNQLECLKLYYTGVTGSGVTGLSLPALSEFHLWFLAFDDQWIHPELSGLNNLPSLKYFDMCGPRFKPSEIEPLRKCLSLTRIRLHGGGLTDDSSAEWMAEMPNLIQLTLSGNCVVSDKGAQSLARNSKIQKLSIGGFIKRESADTLSRMTSLRQLVIDSSEISREENEVRQVATAPFVLIRPFKGEASFSTDGSFRILDPDIVEGSDGLLRSKARDQSLREKMGQLEGKQAATLDPIFENGDFANQLNKLHGRVLILDFWGTWCGPCRIQNSELKQLYDKYHHKGLEIVGVHTESGAEKLEEFVAKKKLPWLNIVDTSDKIGKVFLVPHYPSLFIVDREGILRVALAHPVGLEQAINSFLEK